MSDDAALALAERFQQANEQAAVRAKQAAENYRNTGGSGPIGYYDGEAGREEKKAARHAAHAEFWTDQIEALTPIP